MKYALTLQNLRSNGATASIPWKSSATIKLTHCPHAINPTDAVIVALNVVAIEALVTDLHPGTQRVHGRKFLDGEPDRLRCGRKTAITKRLSSPALALAHEQFGGYAVVECHSLAVGRFAFMLNSITEIDRKGSSRAALHAAQLGHALARLHNVRAAAEILDIRATLANFYGSTKTHNARGRAYCSEKLRQKAERSARGLLRRAADCDGARRRRSRRDDAGGNTAVWGTIVGAALSIGRLKTKPNAPAREGEAEEDWGR